MIKILKNNEKYLWTNHVVGKMGYYGLSMGRVLRVINYPKRKETGVAPNTVASMQPSGSKNRPYEIWVMYQEKVKSKSEKLKIQFKNKKIIISAWKYPGISPLKGKIPIPEDIEAELEEILQTF